MCRKKDVKFWIEKIQKEEQGRVFEDKGVRDMRGPGRERNSLWNDPICNRNTLCMQIGILIFSLASWLTQYHIKGRTVKSPIAHRDMRCFKYSATSSQHGEAVMLKQCSDENKRACYFRDGKGTFHLLPPTNLLQPFISQKKQWA